MVEAGIIEQYCNISTETNTTVVLEVTDAWLRWMESVAVMLWIQSVYGLYFIGAHVHQKRRNNGSCRMSLPQVIVCLQTNAAILSSIFCILHGGVSRNDQRYILVLALCMYGLGTASSALALNLWVVHLEKIALSTLTFSSLEEVESNWISSMFITAPAVEGVAIVAIENVLHCRSLAFSMRFISAFHATTCIFLVLFITYHTSKILSILRR